MIRFILIGGFLGAGKTTTIARLADAYRRQGLNVAIVTNDQGNDLVDTHRLRAMGHHVGELTGTCFCGNVDALLETVAQLGIAARPDVVLVEPIGSCLDLKATVIQPLTQQTGEPASVAPYVVLLKPRHGLRILENQPQAGVSPAAVYIFRQQLAEADIVAINRIDELPEVEIARLTSLLEQHYPGRRLLPISAKTGQGFAALEQLIARPGDSATDPPAIDYAQYAAGEAALGWLNGSLFIAGPAPFSLAALVLDLVRQMQTGLIAAGGQIAHVKAIGSAHGATAAANVVGNDFSPDFSLASAQSTTQAEVTVNARVGIDPENLQRCVLTAIDEVCAARRLQSRIVQMQSFRPNGPAPPYCVVP